MSAEDVYENLKGRAVVPGDRIVKCERNTQAGSGCCVAHAHIYSTLIGFVSVQTTADEKTVLFQVVRSRSETTAVPAVGAVVTCRVLGATSKYAKCSILVCNNSILPHPFNGIVRREDIQPIKKTCVDVFKSFRTDDIIIAKVIGLGDSYTYLLTTAEKTLGVVFGLCDKDHKMLPSSLKAVRCSECGVEQNRKVALLRHRDSSDLAGDISRVSLDSQSMELENGCNGE